MTFGAADAKSFVPDGGRVELTAAQTAALDAASAFDVGYPYAFIAAMQQRW